MGILASTALPASAATSTIDSGNLQGWSFFQEAPNLPTSTGSMVSGPSTPPIGVGSANLVVGATGGMVIGKAAPGVRLDTITALEYSTYRTSGPAAAAASLQLNIDNDVTDENMAWQGRLVYEPYHDQTVTTGQWQTWNTLAETGTGNWWGSPNGVSGLDEACPQSDPCTWDEVLGAFPNIGIHSSLGAVLLKLGSGGGPANTNVDKLVINDDIYDFEPVPSIDLGVAEGFSLLAGAAITTGASNVLSSNIGAGAAITTGAGTAIIGDLDAGKAITLGAGSDIEGSLDAGTAITLGAGSTVSGAQAIGVATPIAGYFAAMTALDDAMVDAFSLPVTMKATELGGTTLESGVYSPETYFTLTGILTLDAKDNPDAVFIMRSPGYISTAAGSSVVLLNGAKASNVFWVTGSYFSAGAGAVLAGNIMAKSYATLGAGADFTGHLFAQSGYITLGADVTLKN